MISASSDTAVRFGQVPIGVGHPVAIIAEIGINHEGDADVCGQMIEAAARAGADLVKLQVIDPTLNYAPGTVSHDIFTRAWIEQERIEGLFRFAREIGIEIFATTGDAATFDLIDRLAPAGHKVSSGLLTHIPLIERAARSGHPLMMSTGMAEDGDVDAAMASARRAGASGIVLLHCTSIYPAPENELHLAAIPYLAERHAVPVGYSDHSLGIEAAAIAAGIGAVAVEKHFTLDVRRPDFDHRLSLEPEQFAAMVQAVRRAEKMRGEAHKILSAEERKVAAESRRYVAAARPLTIGTVIEQADIAFLRLLPGAPRKYVPSQANVVVGRRVRRAILPFTAITAEDIE